MADRLLRPSVVRWLSGLLVSVTAVAAISVLIGLLSTLAAVCLATLCAYGFSRFRIPGTKDWLFFVLSTRFLPPLAVVVPVLGHSTWHLYRKVVEPDLSPRPEFHPRPKGRRYAADFPASLFAPSKRDDVP